MKLVPTISNIRYSLFVVIIIDLVFQIVNIVDFTVCVINNARLINNVMISIVIVTYFIAVLTRTSNINRFQLFIASMILFSLRKFCDDLQTVNLFYHVQYVIFNMIGIIDVFYIKKDYGVFLLDFIFPKNWFNH